MNINQIYAALIDRCTISNFRSIRKCSQNISHFCSFCDIELKVQIIVEYILRLCVVLSFMWLRNPVPKPLKLLQFFGPPDLGVSAGRVLASYQFYLQAGQQRPEMKIFDKNKFSRHHKDVTIT